MPRVGETGWADVYEQLAGADPDELTPEDLETLAEAAWWMSRYEETIAARQRAYAGHLDRSAAFPAALVAWRLFYDHLYRGETAVALGWLRRAHRHVRSAPESVEHGYLAFAEAELALGRGEFEEAEARAAVAVELGHRFDEADLTALALQLQGRALIAAGRVESGSGFLDEAMTFVLTGQLSEFFTGAVYCAVIAACRDIADVRRAAEWTEAAMSWCDSIRHDTPFHGICRLHRGEVLGLLGAWQRAEAETRLACDELMRYSPLGAAEAYVSLGEIQRHRGDLEAAEEAFTRANELGGDPQPGLALVRLAQGRIDVASVALRSALRDVPPVPLRRARLLAAQVEVALVGGELDVAREATDQLVGIGGTLDRGAVRAMVSAALGRLRLAEGQPQSGVTELRRALAIWVELGVPYEAARCRLLMGMAMQEMDDQDSARLELDAARSAFDRLGAQADVRRAMELLGTALGPGTLLTAREIEVLRLVAAGGSNREVAADLVISEHTVARHLQNIFTKLGVSSRTAAAASALKHGIL